MSKIEFQYSKKAVSKAGVALLDEETTDEDAHKQVLDNWRACHIASLNSFQSSLRYQLKKNDNTDALVSQRLKRYPSILSKLKRNPGMQLARMQDIGGIRVVVKSMRELRKIEAAYVNGTKVFTKVNGGKDYINYPKGSGYRSLHMIFKCKNGFSIELQIRTTIQHSWATAIETMGTFLNDSLKSSEGPEEWLNFFSLASSGFAVLESTPRVPDHDWYSAEELFRNLIRTEEALDVTGKLSGFKVAARQIGNDKRNGDYHLILLDLDKPQASIKSFKHAEIDTANSQYTKFEKKINQGENWQVVLVNSSSIKTLKKAYPSYFLDAELFIKQFSSVKKRLEKIRKNIS